MLQFMGDNKRLLNLHEKKLSELEAFKSNTQIFQTNTSASLENLETQVGQLALTLQKKTKNAFPSDTQKNPKDCMAFQLRSGREMSSSRAEKKEKIDQKEEKEIERDDRMSNSEQIAETEKQVQTKQPGVTCEKTQKENIQAYTSTVPFQISERYIKQKEEYY